MSRARVGLLCLLIAGAGLGCWEQVSVQWFSQMKDQPAVQAMEDIQPLLPPEGTIPVGGIEPRIISPMPAFMPEAVTLQNPEPATPESVARGEALYKTYCMVCHGDDGMANVEKNPVAKFMADGGMPPLPLVAVPNYPDGLIFTKIRYGKPGMPGYPQIASRDRWHVVNYLRTLIKTPALPPGSPAPPPGSPVPPVGPTP